MERTVRLLGSCRAQTLYPEYYKNSNEYDTFLFLERLGHLSFTSIAEPSIVGIDDCGSAP